MYIEIFCLRLPLNYVLSSGTLYLYNVPTKGSTSFPDVPDDRRRTSIISVSFPEERTSKSSSVGTTVELKSGSYEKNLKTRGLTIRLFKHNKI